MKGKVNDSLVGFNGGISCTGYQLKVSACLDRLFLVVPIKVGRLNAAKHGCRRINLLTDHLGAKLTRSLHLTDTLTVYKCNYRFSIFVFRE